MSKHTKGPWNVLDRAVLKGKPGIESTWIIASCPVNALGHRTKAQEARANAQLIAAAPELLAVSKRLLERDQHCLFDFLNPCSLSKEPGKHWGGGDRCLVCAAKEATAKAEGKE